MRRDDSKKRERSRKGLNPEDGALGCERAKDSGHDHAAEEEKLDGISAVAAENTPDETRRQTAVVAALIGRQTGRRFGDLRRKAKNAQTGGLRPEKHLEDQKADVQQRHDDNGHV